MTNLFGGPRRARPEGRDIHAQARDYLIQLDDEPVSSEKLAEVRAWLGRSPLHRRAFEQAAAVWQDMDCLSKVLDGKLPASSGDTDGASHPSSGSLFGWPGRGRLATVAVAAALVGIVVLAAALYMWRPGAGQAPLSTATYETATGEIKTITLSDGSTVHLNTGSTVVVAYGNKARILQLAAGEAYFEVAPNPQRPFIVYTGRFAVRALGTAFAVHKLDSGVDLTVTKGHVELASFKSAPASITGLSPSGTVLGGGEAAEAPVPVSSGQHATVAGDVRLVEQIDVKGIEKRLSWRDGMLIFDDDPLTNVVSEINRYTSTKIIISDPSIRNLKVGGYFKVQDIGSILDTLQEGFGIEIRKDKDAVYLARGRHAQ